MDERVSKGEDQLDSLTRTIALLTESVEALGRRVAALESAAGSSPAAVQLDAAARPGAVPPAVGEAPASAAAAVREADAPEPAAARALQGLPALVGRLFLVLAGAFLLRTLTESRSVSQATGVLLGLAYAAVWTYLAGRAGRAGPTLGATFHGLATAVIAFPLIWEATARFGVLGPRLGAACLALFTTAGLAVAWWRRLRGLAALITLGAMCTATLLIGITHAPVPYGLVLFGTAGASLLLAHYRGWTGACWTSAIILSVLVLLCGVFVGTPNGAWLPRPVVVTTQLALAALYIGSFLANTLRAGRQADRFDMTLGVTALLVGFEGAVITARAGGTPAWPFGLGALVAAAACLAVTWVFIERRQDRRTLACYVTLAVFLGFEGLRLVLPAAGASVAWALLAVVAAAVARTEPRQAWRVHLAVLLLAAAVGSGLLRCIFVAYAAPADGLACAPSPAAWLVLGACASSYALLRGRVAGRRDPWSWELPGFALAVIVSWGVGAALISWLAPLLTGTQGGHADAGGLAALRTGVLVALVVGLAVAGRRRLRRELVWGAYFMLALSGLKIAAEDVPQGRAVTLFLSLALFGAALIAAPWLLRRRSAPAAS